MRLACVQNGDYTSAAERYASAESETYNGQFYTVRAYQDLAGSFPNIVISLDAGRHEKEALASTRVGIPAPSFGLKLPRRIIAKEHARRVIRRLEEFSPTHLLLRCVDLVGCELLAWANSRQIPAAAIVAARFDPHHRPCTRYCELANDPNVAFVANHNRVATQTLLECGLRPDKAIAWDLPPSVTPDQYAARRRVATAPIGLLFAGSLVASKGVQDFVEAASLCRAGGRIIEAVICGAGPLLTTLRNHPGVNEGWLMVLGQIPQQEVVRRMSETDFLVVPSRKEFSEGLPFVIQEGLPVRTPLLLSDHPIFVRYFREGMGVRFFPERDSRALADLILRLADDTAEYARLSEQTAAAWQSLHCPTKYHDLLERLKGVWGRPTPSTRPDLRILSLAKS